MTGSSRPSNLWAADAPLFLGRQNEIDWVANQLARDRPCLVIHGAPYAGKTSLLRQLVHRLPSRYLAVYLDGGKAGGPDPAPSLLQSAGQVGRSVRRRAGVQVEAPEKRPFAADPAAAWRAYVGDLSSRLQDKQLVLLIDNADHAPPTWLHSLLEARTPLILAAESRDFLSRFLPGPAPPSIALGPLDTESGEALVKAIVAQRSAIDPWATRRILEAASNHPYYVRFLCHALLECCAHVSPVTPLNVEETLKFVLEARILEFDETWQASSAIERELLSLFASLKGQGGIATQYDIQKLCSRYGLRLPLSEITAALDHLAGRDVLEKLGANSYRFQVELFRLWIRQHHAPDRVLRPRPWRFEWSVVLRPLATLIGVLSQRPLLSAALGVIALVAALAIVQPGRSAGEPGAHTSPTPATTAAASPAAMTRSLARTAVVALTPTPSTALPGYDLAFMARVDSDSPWQIYVLNSRQGERLRLTETLSNERTPRWSPDGKRLLFASDRDGNREIYVWDIEQAPAGQVGGQLTNLTQNEAPDWQPAWAPDGERVAFSSYRDENWEVYTVRADGTEPTRLTDDPASDFSPTWSPDGRKILFASRRRGDADLFTIDVATGELTQLTRSKLDEYDPAWSPDGQWIAFATYMEDQSDIFVMRADGSDQVNITQSAYANDFQPTWTPDSAWLTFVSYTSAEGDHDIFRMQRDGSQVSKLFDDSGDDLAPSWRPAGTSSPDR
jgi:Tol biopolymer transport system component